MVHDIDGLVQLIDPIYGAAPGMSNLAIPRDAVYECGDWSRLWRIARCLIEHCRSPEYSYRFRRQPHSIAFRDNRCRHHYAINDYFPQTRSGYRVQTEGAARLIAA